MGFYRKFFQVKDFEEKDMPEILKKSSKTGDRVSVLQRNEKSVPFHIANRQPIRSL